MGHITSDTVWHKTYYKKMNWYETYYNGSNTCQTKGERIKCSAYYAIREADGDTDTVLGAIIDLLEWASERFTKWASDGIGKSCKLGKHDCRKKLKGLINNLKCN